MGFQYPGYHIANRVVALQEILADEGVFSISFPEIFSVLCQDNTKTLETGPKTLSIKSEQTSTQLNESGILFFFLQAVFGLFLVLQ